MSYLNSLQSTTADSENSLAESQAISRFFGYIHVPLKVTDYIFDPLTNPSRKNVILTGHAGDGKSTVGLELYKRLKNISPDVPLEQPMTPREELYTDNGYKIVLIKDMSELSSEEHLQLLEEAVSSSADRFFIISNTGTLIESFRDYYESHNLGQFDESELLEAMDSRKPKEMNFLGTKFDLINLAMVDNIGAAGELLERMVAPDRWEQCQENECKDRCPIYRNVRLIQDNLKTVSERISLVYRKMYENGERLTLRQISSHLAYIITSGLTYEKIDEFSRMPIPPSTTKFLFFNRFFGDNGIAQDENANQLKAVRSIFKQEFGSRLCPSLERMLWTESEVNQFNLRINGARDEFDNLRKLGVRLDKDSDSARRQVRRMLYFLEPFEQEQGEMYIRTFLNSPMITKFAKWRDTGNALSIIEKKALKRRVMHVIQEHFSGVRLPESRDMDPEVFITLNRRSRNIRQSAQIVLARYQTIDFSIELDTVNTEIGHDYNMLMLKESRSQEVLQLELPFLDYVMMRQQGEVGQILQAAYVDRLDNFKSRLLKAGQEQRSQEMMLVRLRTNRTFKKQIFTVRSNLLEVVDD